MTVGKGKILVVLTGGTIGSTCSDGVRGIKSDSPYILIREFRRAFPEYSGCEFEVINPYSILSENLTCGVWNLLYTALYAVNISAFDGIIIGWELSSTVYGGGNGLADAAHIPSDCADRRRPSRE